jgi:hypothetical protein
MFVLKIADNTPVLNICIWQTCSKHWVLGELWKQPKNIQITTFHNSPKTQCLEQVCQMQMFKTGVLSAIFKTNMAWCKN